MMDLNMSLINYERDKTALVVSLRAELEMQLVVVVGGFLVLLLFFLKTPTYTKVGPR